MLRRVIFNAREARDGTRRTRSGQIVPHAAPERMRSFSTELEVSESPESLRSFSKPLFEFVFSGSKARRRTYVWTGLARLNSTDQPRSKVDTCC